MSKKLFGLTAAVVTLGLAFGGSAMAKPKDDKPAKEEKADKDATGPVLGARVCALSDITGPASACSGWYEGNLNGGSPDKIAEQIVGLNELFPSSDPFNTGNFVVLAKLEKKDNGDVDGPGSFGGNGSGGFIIDFDQELFGQTIVSFHVGGANGQPNGIGYNATAFFLFDAGDDGLDTFTLNIAGLSNVQLYSTGTDPCAGGSCTTVPEPNTWGLMILGFGAAGAVLRRRRGVLVA